jgi:hypothetical protein
MPPTVPPSFASNSSCVLKIDGGAILEGNHADVAGAVVFFETLPLESCNVSSINERLQSFHEGNTANYGGAASSFASNLTFEYNLEEEASVTISDAHTMRIYPGLDTTIKISALDCFGSPIKGNYESLQAMIQLHPDAKQKAVLEYPVDSSAYAPLTDGSLSIRVNFAIVKLIGVEEGTRSLEVRLQGSSNISPTHRIAFDFLSCKSGDASKGDFILQEAVTSPPSSHLVHRYVCRPAPTQAGLVGLPLSITVTLCTVSSLLAVGGMVTVVSFRNRSKIKYRSVFPWSLRFIGIVLASSFIASTAASPACSPSQIAGTLGFQMIFSSYIFMFWRLKKIFRNTSMVRSSPRSRHIERV